MRFRTVCLVAALVVAIVPSAKSGPAPKPTTLYFHGNYPAGELDVPENLVGFVFSKMDPIKPEGGTPKSKALAWGNTKCAGNHFFPVWVGSVNGSIVGDMKVVFSSVSIPQEVDIRVWDTGRQLCNNDYATPLAKGTVMLPAGQGEVEAVIKNDRMKVQGFLMVQISPTMLNNTDTPGPGRVLYDSADYASRVEFDCIPAAGSKSCTS